MKVVINRCYGGFGLSPLALKRIAERRGHEIYFFKNEYPERKYIPLTLKEAEKHWLVFAFKIPDPNSLSREELNNRWKELFIGGSYIERDDPDLVSVVQELGEKANGRYAKLTIIEIPDGVDYFIDEYDGMESIHENHRSWG